MRQNDLAANIYLTKRKKRYSFQNNRNGGQTTKIFKKMLAVLTAALMLAFAFPLGVFAEGTHSGAAPVQMQSGSVPTAHNAEQASAEISISPSQGAKNENAAKPAEAEPEAKQSDETPPAPSQEAVQPAEDPTAASESTSGGGIVTRAQWLQHLTVQFNMTVEDDNLPDNYSSDLADTSSYYRDMLLAVQFGLVDVAPGEELRPDEPANREFAAHTLNFCLNILLEEGASYTFNESADVTYPDDIQVAVNRCWFALSDGNFLPEQPITQTEVDAMLADAAVLQQKTVIDENYNNVFTFAEGVIVIPAGTEVSISDDNILTILNNPAPLTAGDRFAVYFDELPCAYTANSVTVENEATIVSVTPIDDGSAFTDVDAQGTIDIAFTQFVPAPGTEFVYIDGTTGIEYTDPVAAEEAVQAGAAARGTIKPKRKLGGKLKIDLGNGIKAYVKFEIENPEITYNFSLLHGVMIKLDSDYEVRLNIKGDLAGTIIPKEVDITFVGVKGIGGLKLSIAFELSGKISTTWSGTLSHCEAFDPLYGFYGVTDFHVKSFNLVIKATAKAGFKVSLGINDVPGDIIEGYIYAEFGAKGEVKSTTYTDGELPNNCTHTAIYLYMEYGAKGKVKLGVIQKECYDKGEVWTYKNSPVKVVHHYEDGVEVPECTR